MSDQEEQRERADKRSFATSAWGDSEQELEQAALTEAQKFFGPDVRCEVVRDYEVQHYSNAGRGPYDAERPYRADVTVREA